MPLAVALLLASAALAVVEEGDEGRSYSLRQPDAPGNDTYSDSWVIHVPKGHHRAQEIAEAAGFTLLRQVRFQQRSTALPIDCIIKHRSAA